MYNKIIKAIALNFSFFLCCCSISKKTDNCTKYKTGSFSFHFENQQETVYFTFIRNDSMQIETNQNTGDISEFIIKWIDECSFQLKFIKGTENLTEDLLQFKKTMTITTTILHAADNYYLFEAKSDKSDYVLTDTIWVNK